MFSLLTRLAAVALAVVGLALPTSILCSIVGGPVVACVVAVTLAIAMLD